MLLQLLNSILLEYTGVLFKILVGEKKLSQCPRSIITFPGVSGSTMDTAVLDQPWIQFSWTYPDIPGPLMAATFLDLP